MRDIRWAVAVMAVVIWGATARPADASVFGNLFAGSCPEWVCGANQHAVTGYSAPRPVRANSIIRTILSFFGLRETAPSDGCDDWGCGANSPIVDGAAIEEPAAPAIVRVGRRPVRANWIIGTILSFFGLRATTPRPGDCDDDWGCGMNSPIVDGAAIEEPAAPAIVRVGRRPVRANWIIGTILYFLGRRETAPSDGCDEWGCGANSPIVDGAAIDVPAALTAVSIRRPTRAKSILRTVVCFFFRCEPEPTDEGCPEWGCGSNSPIVDGASIDAPPAPSSGPVRRPTRASSIIRTILSFFGLRESAPTCDDDWGCGTNSPIVDGAAIEIQAARPAPTSNRSFHELHMGGLPNAAGFAVLGARKGLTAYTVEGAGAAIAARPQAAGAPRLEGPSLVDLVFDLRDAADRRYTLRIAATNTTPFWAEPQGSVRTYALTHTAGPGSTPRPLCTTGVNEAILFAGDRYDSLDKSVVATGAAASGWINIACAGTALAKLYLTRHTEASQIVVTTRGERQAMFKMFTADVCGDGTSFTVHGQPLLWADAKGITKFASAPASIEAIWNETGAVCLDTPRKPELASSIAARCRRASCGGATTPAGRGHAISANPR